MRRPIGTVAKRELNITTQRIGVSDNYDANSRATGCTLASKYTNGLSNFEI